MTTLFELSSRLVDDVVALDPMFATALGLTESNHLWGDLGPAGEEAKAGLFRRYLVDVRDHLDDPEADSRLGAQVLSDSLAERIDGFSNGDHLEDLGHMATTFQRISRIFDLMPKRDHADWGAITTRLETIGAAHEGLRERLDAGIAAGRTVARRQVRSVAAQAERLAGDDSAFISLGRQADAAGFGSKRLHAAIVTARESAADFAGYLAADYSPAARVEDAVGEDRYRRSASRLVGLDVDPYEAYAWGWDELHRLLAEVADVGEAILPQSSLADVRHLLESDPARAAAGPEAFVAFILDRELDALEQLDGSHFDVAPQLRTITVDIAPPGGPLGAYYVRPSEDFTRPGGVWYSIGDQTVFPLYHHVSTAYHEGFPGHHLQVGTAMVNTDRISRAQRLMVWYPGYGEGWALYTERLMQELGYFEIPDYHFGMLAKHLYRATRVVVDIGLHLDLTIPDGAPLGAGEQWSFERAVDYLERFGFRTAPQAKDEVLRYLGWPGQAIAYKLGEREILDIRRTASNREGRDFDLKRFHDRVIGHGAMRLDRLRSLVLGEERS